MGLGKKKGDQQLAQNCYVAALRPDGIVGQVLPIVDMDVWEDEEWRGKPDEDLIPVPLDTINPESGNLRGSLTSGTSWKGRWSYSLQENNDVFAWTAADMPRIDPWVDHSQD